MATTSLHTNVATPNASTALLSPVVVDQRENPVAWKKKLGLGVVGFIVVAIFGFALNSQAKEDKAKVESLAKRTRSFEPYQGGPPQLSSLHKSQWIKCEDYSPAQIAELKTYQQYWVDRAEHDDEWIPLMKKIDLGDAKRAELKQSWPKGDKTYHNCTFYSLGLSGPYNGLAHKPSPYGMESSSKTDNRPRNVTKGSQRALQWGDDWSVFDDDDADDMVFDDDWSIPYPNCTFNDDYYGCAWDFYEAISIIHTSMISFYAVAEANFDFTLDLGDCDIDVDIGGDVYFTFKLDTWIYDYSVTVNIWSGPSVSSDVYEIDVEITYSVFTMEVELSNAVLSSDDDAASCNLTLWDMTLLPGYDVYVYSGDVSIDIGDIDFSSVI